MTTLSILMPHFNDPQGVAMSLRSVERQTWKGDAEIVLYDDGSTPENFGKLERVVERSGARVRIVRSEQNRGRPYARNVLLDAADGKYSAWLDAGDEWYPEKTQLQLDALYRARYLNFDRPVWCTCNYDWQWLGGKPKLREQDVDGDQIASLLVGRLAAYLWTTLAPTENFRSVGYFDLKLPRLQDLDFFLRFASKNGMLILPSTGAPLAVYHKSDIGRQGQEILECFKYLYTKHSPLLMQRTRRFRRNRKFRMYMHAARFTANNSDALRTVQYLATSALVHPVVFTKTMIKNKGQL